jgi:hypothetical protein
MRRWLAFALVVGVIFATLGWAPSVGRAAMATPFGAWAFGRGLPTVLAVAGVGGASLLAWRRAPARAFMLLAVAVAGYAGGLLWLRTERLERAHLPEYSVVAWLGWRALVPTLGDGPVGYVAAAVLASAVGWVEEVLQGFVPGRVYDLRDVGANALAAVVGMVAVAALHTTRSRGSSSDGS